MPYVTYGAGYAAGKEKALFEAAIAACHIRTTPDCGCSPCTTLRHRIGLGQLRPGLSSWRARPAPRGPWDDTPRASANPGVAVRIQAGEPKLFP